MVNVGVRGRLAVEDGPHDAPRAELIARYEERTGRPVTDIGWYETLALWKSAIFMEGNYARALRGTTDDPYLHRSGAAVIELASRAEARLASR